ncbi:hypothetical protein [Chamaesiphon minutus]|uniref:Uncharacterized protein n=1 Tax=Chamaesiphon minutus (strain ATCC 27169 / PCC 6605) TaxID=1173020 RepID=K9UM85_CHAP6|nr:hypothetical protein [Chamaesiphon minutus]AFY95758.1 hypothetical protein Cha6605_4845 [Chamaesiphon minutus PCC 6605]
METSAQSSQSMNWTIWGGAIILVSGLSAIAFPLTTYAVTLATFGIAHVAIELRYIDSQFHDRLDSKIEIQLVSLLLSIAILRCCGIFRTIEPSIAHLLELGCGLGLVLIVTHQLWMNDWKRGLIGIMVACLLGVGIVRDPIVTSVIFAIVHNLTPIGFILQRQELKSKRTLWLCGLLFGLIPLLILLYQFFPLVHLPVETNSIYLSAFIAPAWQQLSIAYPLFSAVAFLQCLHYAVVIGLFSGWTPTQTDSFISWLAPKYFYLSVGMVSVIFLIAFGHSFVLTRAFYGVVASIHAWLEIPLLIMLTSRK